MRCHPATTQLLRRPRPRRFARLVTHSTAALMEREHVQDLAIRRRHAADMAYIGQSHLIEVNLDFTADEPLSALYRAFEAAHERINGHSTGAPAKIVNLRAIHRADLPGIDFGGRTGTLAARSLKAH